MLLRRLPLKAEATDANHPTVINGSDASAPDNDVTTVVVIVMMPLAAVASFHGALGSFHTATPGDIKPSMLICHGAADSMVTMEELSAFRQEMDQAQADYEVLLLDGAKHGFSNPQADSNAEKYGIDLGYQPQADAKSWAAMLSLFEGVL